MGIGDDLLRCKKCGSNQTYVRIITEERVCKKCGNIDKIDRGENYGNV